MKNFYQFFKENEDRGVGKSRDSINHKPLDETVHPLLTSNIEVIKHGYRTPKVGKYKNYKITVDPDILKDNIKWFHEVEDMDTGETIGADLDSYDNSLYIVALWIEAGMPKRIGVGPLRIEDLEKMVEERNFEKI